MALKICQPSALALPLTPSPPLGPHVDKSKHYSLSLHVVFLLGNEIYHQISARFARIPYGPLYITNED